MRPNPILLAASMFGLLLVHGEATAGLIQLTGSTPVVIDDDRYAGDSVSVYQSAPVTLLPVAEIGGFLIGYQFAQIDIQGGQIGAYLHAYTQSDVLLSGGYITGNITASQIAGIDIFGGTIGGSILSEDDAEIRIHGDNFQVDGAPVPFGPLQATSGLLTGTLDSGDSLSSAFQQGETGVGAVYTGSITLVRAPHSVPSISFGGLALLVGLVFAIAVGGLVSQRWGRTA